MVILMDWLRIFYIQLIFKHTYTRITNFMHSYNFPETPVYRNTINFFIQFIRKTNSLLICIVSTPPMFPRPVKDIRFFLCYYNSWTWFWNIGWNLFRLVYDFKQKYIRKLCVYFIWCWGMMKVEQVRGQVEQNSFTERKFGLTIYITRSIKM